jgi:hypothetical protein
MQAAAAVRSFSQSVAAAPAHRRPFAAAPAPRGGRVAVSAGMNTEVRSWGR